MPFDNRVIPFATTTSSVFMPRKPQLRVANRFPGSIRWLIGCDRRASLAIERVTQDHPWDEKKLVTFLRGRNAIGMVAEHGTTIKGFLLYRLHATHIEVVRLAVHPDYRGTGAGRAMVEKLTSKLAAHRRTSLRVIVRETNLDGLQFLRRMGFLSAGVLWGHFEDGRDGFAMVRTLDECEGR